MSRMTVSLVCLLTCMCSSSNLIGADIEADVSTRETYVGLPIVLRISINNATEHETPIMPDVDGLEIELAGPPSRSLHTSVINGRRTQRSTVTYAFRVTPLREGSFTIPPVKVIADGLSSITKAVRVIATKSETDDLMFVEIQGSKKEIYVGEALDLKLKLWIRPYREPNYRVEFDDGDVWSLIANQSTWGPFQQQIESLAQQRRRPAGQRVLREDSEGEQREYFLYELETTVYPDRPRSIDGQDVRIIVNYPVELGRARSPFSVFESDDFFGGSLFDESIFGSFANRLTITESRPIVGEVATDPIRVIPVPMEGRPGDYVGAVGRYSITTQAAPSKVEVGEPVTLQLEINGTGSMDVVRAPPLHLQQDLVADFKVNDEPLAGFVDGTRKVFTTTIRPLRANVTAIPAIEYTFFDPSIETFVTVKSEPIPIEVSEAEVLALDSIVGKGENRNRSSSQPSPSPENSLQIPSERLTSSDALISTTRPTIWTPGVLGILLAPPGVFLLILGFSLHPLLGRLVSARHRLTRSLANAQDIDDVADAIEAFLNARFSLQKTKFNRDQTLGALRAAGRDDLAIRLDRLYQRTNTAMRSLDWTPDLQSQKQEALSIALELTNRKLGNGYSSSGRRLSSTGAVALFFLILPGQSDRGALLAADLEISAKQQQILLNEGITSYNLGFTNPEPIEANEQFVEAAERFQLVIESGVSNALLYFNLAEAAMRADQPARAIANYRRALRLDPGNSLYHRQLTQAETTIVNETEDASGLLHQARRVNDRILDWIPPDIMFAMFTLAWCVFWLILGWRALGWRSPGWRSPGWRSPGFAKSWLVSATFTLSLALFAGASYWLRLSEFTRDDTAVLLSSRVSLRGGDGEEFPEVDQLENLQGRTVRIVNRRGRWLHIETASNRRGWIKLGQAETI